MRVVWNPSVTRMATNLEAGSWLLVGDIVGDITAYNCKTLEQVGKYKAHGDGAAVQKKEAAHVRDVVFWPQVAGVTCSPSALLTKPLLCEVKPLLW